MAAKFIVKYRDSDGGYVHRSVFGTRRGLRWGKWRKWGAIDSFDALDAAVAAAQKIMPGLRERAVFHKGKKVWSDQQ